METISIKDRDNDISLLLDGNSINCYACYDTNILNYFKLFKLSNNNSYIGKYNQYDIVLDNNTGLKHYLYNGIDDINMLFLNNGEYSIRYKGKKNKISKRKIFRINGVSIATSLFGILFISGVLFGLNEPKMMKYDHINNYEVNDIKDMIYSSRHLNNEEKDYLYNEDFLNDVLSVINDSEYLKYKYSINFNNIDIRKDYAKFKNDTTAMGYYDTYKPNILFVKYYEELDNVSKDTVSHEFVHLCQDINGYNLIIEACAEIISSEYFKGSKINSYYEQVKLLKKLMEIIGSDVVWNYCFTGDFSLIEERVKPFLSDDEYKEFLDDLTFDYDDEDVNEMKFVSLHNILRILYKNIYNDDIENNTIINMIDKNDNDLYRYYFNDRKESFYYEKNTGEYRTLTYKEAIDYEIIQISALYREEIDLKEAYKLIDKHSIHLHREIDFSHNNISIVRATSGFNGYRISANIDGVYYDDVEVDELAKKGIIKVDYYYTESKVLTFDDLVNENYLKGSEIMVSKESSTILGEECVYAFMKEKVILPSVNDNYFSCNKSLSLNNK